MTDEEMVEMIQEGIADDGRIVMEYLQIECIDGKPIISGRVSSEEELQIIDEILTDVLDIEKYDNSVWVDDSLAFDGSSEADDNSDTELNLEDDDDTLDEDPFGAEDE